jgi:Mitochondrial genome maintenance MGM101
MTVIKQQVANLNWSLRDSWQPTEAQAAILRQPVDPDWVEVRYPNVPYLPAAYYRKVFDDAFGIGGWQLMETGTPNKIDDGYYQSFVFKVGVVPIMKKVGAYVVRGQNEVATPANAIEACRSNAEMRIAKELGVARELWWPSWVRKWLKEYCVEVDRTKRGIPILARKDDDTGYDALKTAIDQRRVQDMLDEYGSDVHSHWEEITKPRRANERPLNAEYVASTIEQVARAEDATWDAPKGVRAETVINEWEEDN